MNIFKTSKKVTLLIFIFLVSISLALAEAPPPIPHQFYGSVKINGLDAPDGTNVKAEIDNVEKETGSTSEGLYGYSTAFYVEGSISDIIKFYVNGIYADETPFLNGGITEFNLSVELPCEQIPESCNGIDDNCNGQIDEDFTDLDDSCSIGTGQCSSQGVKVCSQDGTSTECNAEVIPPEPESCNGLDDDCDGTTDEDFPDLGDACSIGVGICLSQGTKICSQDGSATECDAEVIPPVEEICDNGLDDDCDGEVDENCECSTDADCDDSNECTDDVCNQGICEYSYNQNPCEDGLFCTVEDACQDGVCVSGGQKDCSANNIPGVADCNNQPDDSNPFTWDYRDAFTSSCDEANDICTLGDTTISNTCDKSCGAECVSDSDCEGESICLESCTCSVIEIEYCIEISSMRLLDADFNEIQSVSPGEFFNIEVNNSNICQEDILSMQIIQIIDMNSTPLNLGTLKSNIAAGTSSIVTAGFTLDSGAGTGIYTAEAFNWNSWSSKAGWEAYSTKGSMDFTVA